MLSHRPAIALIALASCLSPAASDPGPLADRRDALKAAGLPKRCVERIPGIEQAVFSDDPADRRTLFEAFSFRMGGRSEPGKIEGPPGRTLRGGIQWSQPAFVPTPAEWTVLLRAVLSSPTDGWVRDSVSGRIGQADRHPDLDAFLEAQARRGDGECVAALNAMARLRPDEVREWLVPHLVHGRAELRESIRVIGQHRLPGYSKELEALLSADGADVLEIVRAMVQSGCRESEPAVRVAAERGSPAPLLFYAAFGGGTVPSKCVQSAIGQGPRELHLAALARAEGVEEGLRSALEAGRQVPGSGGWESRSALAEFGDLESGKVLAAQLESLGWGQDAWHAGRSAWVALNALADREFYDRVLDTVYPLTNGTVAEHLAALSRWTGRPFEADPDLPAEWLKDPLWLEFSGDRLRFVLHGAGASGFAFVVGPERVRVTTRPRAAEHWRAALK